MLCFLICIFLLFKKKKRKKEKKGSKIQWFENKQSLNENKGQHGNCVHRNLENTKYKKVS